MRGLDQNPFFVLGLEPSCTRMEMERQGQLLLSMLEIGFAEAITYETPLGDRTRTPEAVREAMASLRDPDTRLATELWAQAPIGDDKETGDASDAKAPNASRERWPQAMKAMGWRR